VSSTSITGLGIALPGAELTNDELAARLGCTPDWIRTRTGISTRRVAGPHETTDQLGRVASLLALADAGLDSSDVDLVICATVTAERRFPSTACLIQSALGTTAPAFDIGAGCSGFLYALQLADATVRTNNARRVLVVGSEVLSGITDANDPKTSVLFGDGAGAAVVEAGVEGLRIGPIRLFSDGSSPELLFVNPSSGFIAMEGREVFRAAVGAMTASVAGLLEAEGLSADEVDLIVAHQANQRILDAVAERLGLDSNLLYSNIVRYGNTSAASIPIALYEARRDGLLNHESVVVLTAFGAGFTWGAGLLHGGPPRDAKRMAAASGRHV
jgi:3-oxoacyl-[acyl-carrier-protein] synthase-3